MVHYLLVISPLLALIPLHLPSYRSPTRYYYSLQPTHLAVLRYILKHAASDLLRDSNNLSRKYHRIYSTKMQVYSSYFRNQVSPSQEVSFHPSILILSIVKSKIVSLIYLLFLTKFQIIYTHFCKSSFYLMKDSQQQPMMMITIIVFIRNKLHFRLHLNSMLCRYKLTVKVVSY